METELEGVEDVSGSERVNGKGDVAVVVVDSGSNDKHGK
jgi:hypothetical protein